MSVLQNALSPLVICMKQKVNSGKNKEIAEDDENLVKSELFIITQATHLENYKV